VTPIEELDSAIAEVQKDLTAAIARGDTVGAGQLQARIADLQIEKNRRGA